MGFEVESIIPLTLIPSQNYLDANLKINMYKIYMRRSSKSDETNQRKPKWIVIHFMFKDKMTHYH